MLHKPEGDCCSPTAYMQFNLQKEIQFSFFKCCKRAKESYSLSSYFLSFTEGPRAPVEDLLQGDTTLWRYHKTTLPFEKYLH